MVKSKRHFPDLARKNRKNYGTLHAEKTSRKKRHESGYRDWKKAKDRHRLQDIERRKMTVRATRFFAAASPTVNVNNRGNPNATHILNTVRPAQSGCRSDWWKVAACDAHGNKQHPAPKMQHTPRQSKDFQQNHGIPPIRTLSGCFLAISSHVSDRTAQKDKHLRSL